MKFMASSSVKVTRFPDGEVRLKPEAPKVEGTTQDAAKELGVTTRTILRMIAEKEIPAWRPGKRAWRLDMTAVYERKAKRRKEQEDS